MIVSAIPFAGNKRKLWKQIEPLLPEGHTFIDMFTGGGTVALNAVSKYEKVVALDVLTPLIGLHKAYQEEGFIERVSRINDHYESTKEGYLQLRKDYNMDPTAAKLQNLVLRSNTNYMRFNKSRGEFNMTYGERNHFNEDRMSKHRDVCGDISFCNLSYMDYMGVGRQRHNMGLVYYSDCPYANTVATYLEQGGWTDTDDEQLLKKLLLLHDNGGKVVASNVFKSKGMVNHRWISFCEENDDKFTVHHLDRCYNNCSFRKGTGETDEVLIVSK